MMLHYKTLLIKVFEISAHCWENVPSSSLCQTRTPGISETVTMDTVPNYEDDQLLLGSLTIASNVSFTPDDHIMTHPTGIYV